jgi:hypothetical protein
VDFQKKNFVFFCNVLSFSLTLPSGHFGHQKPSRDINKAQLQEPALRWIKDAPLFLPLMGLFLENGPLGVFHIFKLFN